MTGIDLGRAALAAAEASRGAGEPAVWTLADEDTTIYIMGTVHLLRPELDWRSDEIDTALNEAGTLVRTIATQIALLMGTVWAVHLLSSALKLGTGGLVRAYGAAAAAVLDVADVIEVGVEEDRLAFANAA